MFFFKYHIFYKVFRVITEPKKCQRIKKNKKNKADNEMIFDIQHKIHPALNIKNRYNLKF